MATLMAPDIAIVHNGDQASVWKIQGNAIHKIAIVLGPRDQRRGDYVVKSGLTEGDQLLRSPGSTLKEGQRVDTSNKPAVAVAKGK